jgi:hypothetical protein
MTVCGVSPVPHRFRYSPRAAARPVQRLPALLARDLRQRPPWNTLGSGCASAFHGSSARVPSENRTSTRPMGEDQDQEAALPQADGPLVKVELPDHQVLFAVVNGRRQEADTSWWFDLQIHLPSQGSERGRLLAVPAAVDFRAPAGACQPIEGQSYEAVPTERYGVPARWRIREAACFLARCCTRGCRSRRTSRSRRAAWPLRGLRSVPGRQHTCGPGPDTSQSTPRTDRSQGVGHRLAPDRFAHRPQGSTLAQRHE